MSKIIVGMSGGVDSSVAAYLLKQQNHEVIALYMQNWDPALNNDLADPFINEEICQAEQDYNDAKLVCDKLGIELHRVNFVKEYWDYVFTYFLEQYKKGRTPNPDVFCNKYIKFKAFLDYAFENFNCDYIAMGHYAKVEHEPSVRLLRAKDSNKDQTYFLEQLSAEQLSKSLFPLGDLTKDEVRKIAVELDLVTATKKDSTGICFIGERNFSNFLNSYITNEPGDIIDIETNFKLTKHTGITHYTIGQRKGLNIGGDNRFKNARWFVCAKDLEKNVIYVCQDEQSKYLLSNEAIIENINYINVNRDLIKTAKFRYRSVDVNVLSYEWIDETTLKINYEQYSAVTPGQACVFYNEQECLGGGEVKQVKYNGENRVYEINNN